MEYKIENFLTFKDNILKYIIKILFNELKKYIDSGEIIFTGSFVYNKIGLTNKKHFKDIDIAINNGENGDYISNLIVLILYNIELNEYRKIFNEKYKNKITINNKLVKNFKQILLIDVFRSDHPKFDEKKHTKLYIFDDVYTIYFGHEFYLNETFNLLLRHIKKQKLLKGDDDICYFIKSYNKKLKNFLEYIDYESFSNKKLLKEIDNIINIKRLYE
jgi:hypothetical protein